MVATRSRRRRIPAAPRMPRRKRRRGVHLVYDGTGCALTSNTCGVRVRSKKGKLYGISRKRIKRRCPKLWDKMAACKFARAQRRAKGARTGRGIKSMATKLSKKQAGLHNLIKARRSAAWYSAI